MIRERRNSWAGRGPIAVIHPTEEDARAQLVGYMRENWDAKMGDDPPEDDDGLIEEYFDLAYRSLTFKPKAVSTSATAPLHW